MKKIVVLSLLILTITSYGQKEANNWYFGNKAGLDFSNGTAVVLENSQMTGRKGCASLSDENGNLLFYTNGSSVWNRNHTIMPNGTSLTGTSWFSWATINTLVALPLPDSNSKFLILTIESLGKFSYSEINMTLDAGLGAVTANKNKPINNFLNQRITAVKHSNGKDIWVITHLTGKFVCYLVTSSGISLTPIETIIGADYNFGLYDYSQIKVSPNGKKLAIAHYEADIIEVFDFNTTTGAPSNPIEIKDSFETHPQGLAFSGSGNILYVSGGYSHYYSENGILQYNLKANNINASKVNLANFIPSSSWGALQMAPDGKIYITRGPSNYDSPTISYLSVINKPEVLGIGCDFQLDAINLGTGKAELGLPTFLQSYFNVGFYAENLCHGNDTNFFANASQSFDSILWDFGDGATSTDENPVHTYTNPGTYNVTVKVFSGIEVAETTKEIIIDITPTSQKPTDLKICDADNDGSYSFDLTTQNTTILNGQDPLLFNVKYYAGLTNYTIETEITSPNSYTNQTAFTLETIYAKVFNINNQNCYDAIDFSIQVFESPLPNTNLLPLTSCDNTSVGSDTDGIIQFDLTQKETEILNGQSANNFTIEYFSDAGYLAPIVNPATFQNTANPQTIYVKMANNGYNLCVAKTNFTIKVFELPTITSPVTLKQCDNADINGFSIFNLEEVNNKISSNASNETITFFTNYNGAFNNNILELITIPTSFLNPTVSNSKVWARVENSNHCFRVSEINLIVSTTQIPISYQIAFYECDDFVDAVNNEKDGVATFNFSGITSEIKNIFPSGQQLIINYYRNEADALAEENPILDTSNYRNIGYPTTQSIYVRVDSKLDNDCLGLGAHITLNVEQIPIANPVTIDRQCDDDFDGSYPFDISTIEKTVLKDQKGMIVSYIDELGNTLPSPLPNPFLTKSQIITIRVTESNSQNINGACFAETTLEFIVDKKPLANPVTDFIECDDDLDGMFSFNTSTIGTIVLNGQTGMLVSYFDENGDILPSPLPNPFLTGSRTITAMVENQLNSTCISQTTINFIVHPKPEFELDETDIICLNIPPKELHIFNPKETNYTFLWTDANGTEVGNQPSVEITKGGIYSVVATSLNGCNSFPQNIEVYESNIAVLTIGQIKITDDSDNNIISIESYQLGIGDYEYAIQKEDESIGFYQDEPIFENISPGIYTVYVNDKNNCGTVNLDVSVIGYQKFFTPNNDGYNDYWNVIGINSNFYPNSLIYIFDRFGKLVTTVDPSSNGWNGYFNGASLPSSDYWFTVELIDNNGNRKIRNGHFSLIR